MKFDYYKEILNLSGIEFLTNRTDFISSQLKYDFKCSNGHLWSARLSDVISKGLKRDSKGCPHCAKEIKDKISEDVVEKNLKEGHEIISYQLKVTEKKSNRKERFYTVKCPYDHIYEKRSYLLKEGCPHCSLGIFIGEERVRLIFETFFNKKFNNVRPDWCINPKTNIRLELDGYNPDLKIAFEYQGRQHFSNNTQYSGDYKKQTKRDLLKKQLCEKEGVKLYILNQVRYYAEDKFVNEILTQLEEQGLHIPKDIIFDFSSINANNSLVEKYKNFKKLVEKNNLTLLSKTLTTMEDEVSIKCEKNHNFTLTASKFKEIIKGKKGRKYFCIECEKDNLSDLAQPIRQIISLDTVKEFAKKINYELISNSYENVNKPLQWKCPNGHFFEKSYRSFQRNKTECYCDKCVEDKLIKKSVINNGQFKTVSGEKITILSVKEFAEKIGYELISDSYENVNKPLQWKCPNGHFFEKSYRSFQRNKTGCYCDECVENKLIKKSVINNGKFKTVNGEEINILSVKEFAKKINHELISSSYENINAELTWKCPNHHIFTKSLRGMKRNTSGIYCSFCRK